MVHDYIFRLLANFGVQTGCRLVHHVLLPVLARLVFRLEIALKKLTFRLETTENP